MTSKILKLKKKNSKNSRKFWKIEHKMLQKSRRRSLPKGGQGDHSHSESISYPNRRQTTTWSNFLRTCESCRQLRQRLHAGHVHGQQFHPPRSILQSKHYKSRHILIKSQTSPSQSWILSSVVKIPNKLQEIQGFFRAKYGPRAAASLSRAVRL